MLKFLVGSLGLFLSLTEFSIAADCTTILSRISADRTALLNGLVTASNNMQTDLSGMRQFADWQTANDGRTLVAGSFSVTAGTTRVETAINYVNDVQRASNSNWDPLLIDLAICLRHSSD